MIVFVDANVLFSAANPSSPLNRLLEEIRAKGRLVTCPLAVDKARRNPMLKRPQWADGLETLLRHFEMFPSAVLQKAIDRAEKARPLLGGAIRSGTETPHPP